MKYRQEVFRDLEGGFLEPIKAFAEGMSRVRSHVAASRQRRHAYQKASWFLDGANFYCDAVLALEGALSGSTPRSAGFQRCGLRICSSSTLSNGIATWETSYSRF